MARTRHLPLYSSAFAFSKEIYRMRIKLPKVLKYDLGQDVFQSAIKILKNVVLANNAKDKTPYLSDLLLEIEVQWVYLRLLYELRAISEGQFKVVSVQLEEIGKQSEAWLKWQKNKKVVAQDLKNE